MRATFVMGLLLSLATPGMANPMDSAEQLIVVVTPEWKAVQGEMRRFEREKGAWVERGKKIPVVVGIKGMAWGLGIMTPGEGHTKDEGDGKAPAGLFHLPFAFGVKGMKTGLDFLAVEPGTTCVDDPQSKAYNTIVDAKHPRDWKSGEDLHALYDFGVVVAHNSLYRERGRGSCIFLHPWRRSTSGTLGCTGVPKDALKEVVGWLSAAKRPLMLQLPMPVYQELQPIWGFPSLSR